MSKKLPVGLREDTETEIEFVSELGRVFVVREGAAWRCAVQLTGHGDEGEGSIGTDGERTAAYQCFEYLSHLLKHDNLFATDAIRDEAVAEAPPDETAKSEQGPPKAGGKKEATGPRKKRGA